MKMNSLVCSNNVGDGGVVSGCNGALLQNLHERLSLVENVAGNADFFLQQVEQAHRLNHDLLNRATFLVQVFRNRSEQVLSSGSCWLFQKSDTHAVFLTNKHVFCSYGSNMEFINDAFCVIRDSHDSPKFVQTWNIQFSPVHDLAMFCLKYSDSLLADLISVADPIQFDNESSAVTVYLCGFAKGDVKVCNQGQLQNQVFHASDGSPSIRVSVLSNPGMSGGCVMNTSKKSVGIFTASDSTRLDISGQADLNSVGLMNQAVEIFKQMVTVPAMGGSGIGIVIPSAVVLQFVSNYRIDHNGILQLNLQ